MRTNVQPANGGYKYLAVGCPRDSLLNHPAGKLPPKRPVELVVDANDLVFNVAVRLFLPKTDSTHRRV